ncbi:membrane protein [Salmonella enterica]|nr:membrane protein [Salmonella enterica]
MFMFLPFLLALSVAMGAINRKDKVSYILWPFYSSSLFYHSSII